MGRKIIVKDISKIEELVDKVRGCGFGQIERLGGLTNHTYKVTTENDEILAVRIPGEGTEDMIDRSDERKSTELACSLGIDAELYYFSNDGTKVSEYIKDAVTLEEDTMRTEKNIKRVSKVLNTLHNCNKDTGVPFDVFDMAASYEKIIYAHEVPMYDDYEEVKKEVMNIREANMSDKLAPCHNDPLCANWVESGEKLDLIDWEYAGMNDPMWDLAAVSIEAVFTKEDDELLLKEYCPDEVTDDIRKNFIANKIYVDYLWTLWAKTRVPFDGQPMEDWATERYERLKNNIKNYMLIEG